MKEAGSSLTISDFICLFPAYMFMLQIRSKRKTLGLTILGKFKLKLREAGRNVLNTEVMREKAGSSRARQNESVAKERKTQMNLDIFYSLNTSTFICASICLALLLLRPLDC